MNPQTFRSWLSERGCTFEETERNRGEGMAAVTVKCGSRRSVIPDAASHNDLAEEDVRRVMEELDLPFNELPGPQSRV